MKFSLAFFCVLVMSPLFAQMPPDTGWWHGKERMIRYQPDGDDFVLVNGKRKFVRALYGTNTAFRVEAGDLPEFALYMPGMGGNFKFGLISGDRSKWLTDAQYIKAIYRPGSMIYEIRDSLLGNGTMHLSILPLADAEGMIIKTSFVNVSDGPALMWVFGGASGRKFSRDGDIGADPESVFYLHAENCRDNSYTLDKNSFRLVYGTGRVLSEEERYEIQHLPDAKTAAPDLKNARQIAGLFPPAAVAKQADASQQAEPLDLYNSTGTSAPVVTGNMYISNSGYYFLIRNAATPVTRDYGLLKAYFARAEAARIKLAGRVKVTTPDKYINTIGGSLSMAADAIWEDPSYLHGAVAWRMRLNAWRGAYVADPLGWHDRARKHFSSYALSQVKTAPTSGVVMDTALHLARHLEKIGTALFSDGYICRNPNGDIRAHHYDMNLVFVDQLLNHFNWTGDRNYVKEMWPLIKRHLAWEKRNFDSDGDGLYDAYAAIWASDALQYSGGGVTHTSAYNYRANRSAAQLATIAGDDPAPYRKEAERIGAAVQRELWLPSQGCFAEYKDLLGKKRVHPNPGVWTIYHALDAGLADPFQSYLNLRYIDNGIPRIPVKAKGLNEKDLYLLSTSNWQPYTWSINNVALAENLHTSLAYWQGNRREEAFHLWRSAILESMYLGASPGGFQQLSFYDAVRGELYRDFADGIGMAGRTLVEGVFGIRPDALRDTLVIQPGYPAAWDFASLRIPDIHYDFKRKGRTDRYIITQHFGKNLHLKFLFNPASSILPVVTVNGVQVRVLVLENQVGHPVVWIKAPATRKFIIEVKHQSATLPEANAGTIVKPGAEWNLTLSAGFLLKIYDPQSVLHDGVISGNRYKARIASTSGHKTVFVQVQKDQLIWWMPVPLYVQPSPIDPQPLHIKGRQEKINIAAVFNDKVTRIFKYEYLGPRPPGPTLQLPTQGIGNWCYPLTMAIIDDSGTRRLAGVDNEITSPAGIAFTTPSDTNSNNIVFVSQWDNFPDSIRIPVSGPAKALHLLMAGSTNPMQTRMPNGLVMVRYTDGTADSLVLENPSNWWPIEQDYLVDGYAFTTGAEMPVRLYLKEGKFARGLPEYTTIKGFSNKAIDGGAATVLGLNLNPGKELESLTVYAVANDVVIGLMAATLVR